MYDNGEFDLMRRQTVALETIGKQLDAVRRGITASNAIAALQFVNKSVVDTPDEFTRVLQATVAEALKAAE